MNGGPYLTGLQISAEYLNNVSKLGVSPLTNVAIKNDFKKK